MTNKNEHDYEMDAVFAPGDTIVNIITGEIVRKGSPGAPTSDELLKKRFAEDPQLKKDFEELMAVIRVKVKNK